MKYQTLNMRKHLILAVFVCLAMSAFSQSKLSTLTRAYLSNRETSEENLFDQGMIISKAVTDDSGVEKISMYLHFNNNIDFDLLENYGVEVESVFENLGVVIASVPVYAIEEISENENIKYMEVSRQVHGTLDRARDVTHADMVHAAIAPLQQAYKGKDVIVGVIDMGFQYNHPAFYNEDHTDLRIRRVWNQNTSSGTPPAGYTNGVEYTTREVLEQKKFDNEIKDNIGHGSHVANIAAGADKSNGNQYYGVASESDLVFVSYKGSAETSIANALKYIFDYADEVKKPAVINLSLGSHVGPHDGTSTFDRVVDELVGEGKIIVGAAGNEGDDDMHISKNFNEDSDDKTLKSFIKFFKHPNTSPNVFGTLDIWSDKDYEIQMVLYNKTSAYDNERILYQSKFVKVSDMKTERITPSFSNEDGVVAKAAVQLVPEINVINNKYHMSVIADIQALPTSGVYLGFVIKADEGQLHVWADDVYCELSDYSVEGWTDGDSNCSVGEVGGTAKKIVTVGAFVTKLQGYDEVFTLGDKAGFSSMGPTADGRIKPDIAAPGARIASAVPNTRAVKAGPAFELASEIELDGATFYYSYMHGTSMAAPFATGTIATWLQANPKLKYDDIIEIFKKTAKRDEFTGSDFPNNKFGYGKIDTYYGLLDVLGKYTATSDVDVPSSMLLYPNPTAGAFNVGFTREESNVSLSVYDVNGRIVYAESVGDTHPGQEVVVNLDNVSNGAYIVKVSGDMAAETFRLIVAK